MYYLLKKTFFYSFCIVIFLSAGLFLGRGFTGCALSSSHTPGPAFYLLSNPTTENIELYKLINHADPLKRLSGYYGMLDRGFIDISFLADRFNREDSALIRRTIVWIMGFSTDFGAVKKIYFEFYDKNSAYIKKEILRSIRKNDSAGYIKFVKEKKVPQKLLSD